MHLFVQPGPAARSPKHDPEDDDLGDLPPLDGAEDDAEPAAEEFEEERLDGTVDGTEDGDPFDDTTGEAEPVEEIAAEGDREGGWLDDAGDAEELDVGTHDLEEEEDGLLDDADEPGVEDEDFGLKDVADALTTDGGEEGFDAEDEELREEDLPRLDADEEGELEDDDFTDPWPSAGEDDRPAWDDRAWERATDLPRVGMARRVVPVEGGAIVAGAMLLRVGPEGAIPFAGRGIHGGAIAVVARTAHGIMAGTEKGGLFLLPDGGDARELTAWRAAAQGEPADLVAHGPTAWLLTRAGALAVSDDEGATWRAAGTGIAAMALDDAGTPVFVEESPRLAVTRGEGADRHVWGTSPLLAEDRRGARSAWTVRARGNVVAAAAFGVGAFRARAGGAWEAIEGTSNATALAIVDDRGTLLVALHSAAEDRAWIARVGETNEARIVAEIGGDADEGDDPRVFDLAWDDREKLAWAVGPFGLAVLRAR